MTIATNKQNDMGSTSGALERGGEGAGDHAAHHNELATAVNALSEVRLPVTFELFGPEPRAAEAMQCDASLTGYSFQGSALSASTQLLLGLGGVVLDYARWLLVYTPKDAVAGVRLVHFDAGPTNIVQIAELTGDATATPVPAATDVTSTLAPIIAADASKFIGYQAKANTGVAAPLIYACRVEMRFKFNI